MMTRERGNKTWLALFAPAIFLTFAFSGHALAETAACLTPECHGNPALVKTITVVGGGTETVPLYVNIDLYNAAAHGTAAPGGPLQCDQCHTDIILSGGTHAAVDKTYGGWARFSKSQSVESILAGTEATRNYFSPAVAASCSACHVEQRWPGWPVGGNAHGTIYKLRAAHIDAGLSAYAGETIGEDYVVGNCNRCHASCQSCHFNSTITRKNEHSILEYWDQVQTNDTTDGTTPPSDSMSEYYMDRTTNIASHDFRDTTYFATDADGVCEACHTGYNRPARNAYYWLDPPADTIPGVVKAANVRRHPQAYELWISGSTVLSPLTGGTNAAHAAMECAACHGTASTAMGDVHQLPGEEYDWRTDGDVQCTDCHDSGVVHTNPAVAAHMDETGTKVSCIGCHTFGLGRDFDLARTGSSTSHDVFIDPLTNEVRPVVSKNKEAIAWYSHNTQTLDPGGSSCTNKCHFEGNLVGASDDCTVCHTKTLNHLTGANTPGPPSDSASCATCHLAGGMTLHSGAAFSVASGCGQCHTSGPGLFRTEAQLTQVATGMHASAGVSYSVTFSIARSGLTVDVDALVYCGGPCPSLTYDWDWGDGTPNGAGDPASHAYASAGVKTIKLTVRMGGLSVGSVTRSFMLTAPDDPPDVSGTTCTWNANTWTMTVQDASTDTDSSPVGTVVVDWGDNTSRAIGVQGQLFSHVYIVPGAYTASLRAIDTALKASPEFVCGTAATPGYFTISGTVRRSDGTTAVSSARVTVRSGAVTKSTYTSVSGAFSVGSLKPGTYTVNVSKPGYTFAAPAATITVGPSSAGNAINAVTP